MIARGFRPVMWVAAVAGSALGCYMLSLQVAAERAELASLERKIVATKQSIRSLQTELGTRGRLSQLERWNAEVLALSAPVAGQFLDSEVTLARLDVNAPRFDSSAPVRLASVESAAAPGAALPAVAPEPAERPTVRQAALVAPAPGALPAPAAPAVQAELRPAAIQARAPSLLDERTLQELGAAARAEREGGTGN